MDLTWKFSEQGISWPALAELYRIAPLGEKDPVALEKAFSASLYKCFIYHEDMLVGAGRVLADGVDCACLCDLAVHPEYQGAGLGGMMVEELINLAQNHAKIILYSTPGKESFYQGYGFKPMITALAIFKNERKAEREGLISSS